jgi:flagellum-specific ATP synthase
MQEIVSPQHLKLARQFRQTLSMYQQNRDLIAIGAYRQGSDPRIDAAIAAWPKLQQLLQQDMHERFDLHASATALNQLGPAIGAD